jgi:hypothetical protein
MQSQSPGSHMTSILTIMRSRLFRLALLLFQALWLIVVLPGHKRGIVSVPGTECEACLPRIVNTDCSKCDSGKPCGSTPQSPGDPASHCALCYFTAMLSLPPVIDLTPPPLRFLELHDLPVSDDLVSASFLATYDGRAPPLPAPFPA